MSEKPLTTQELQTVYQSNEPVPFAGRFEVVESRPPERKVKDTGPLAPREPTVMQLKKGELFPNVEGRAVVWRLLSHDK